jgi:hypothetical protein
MREINQLGQLNLSYYLATPLPLAEDDLNIE